LGGYYSPNPNETITASNWKTYVRDQTVNQFATASARSSAITSPTEGNVSWRNDENVVEAYDGTNWTPVGWIPLASTTIGVATSTVTWSSIPATYRNLLIVAHCKTTEVANQSDILMRFNNDSGSNYSNINITADQAGALGILSGNAQTTMPVMRCAAASLNANVWGGGFAYVMGYSSSLTSNKNVFSLSGEGDQGNQGQFRVRQCSWNNGGASYTATAATRIDLIAGGSSNFAANSTFQLYGFGA
jgi:hypothetical protein